MLEITNNKVKCSWNGEAVEVKLIPREFAYVAPPPTSKATNHLKNFWLFFRFERVLACSSHRKQKYLRKPQERNSVVCEFPYFSIWLVKLKSFVPRRAITIIASNIFQHEMFISAPDVLFKEQRRLNYAFISVCAFVHLEAIMRWNLLGSRPGCWQPTKFYRRP